VRSLTMSRRTKFLTTGAIVFAIGMGGGGLAYAASSGTTATFAQVHIVKSTRVHVCPSITLKEVRGVKAPKVAKTETPIPVKAKPVVCPTLVPVHTAALKQAGIKAPKAGKTGVLTPVSATPVVTGLGRVTSGR
jgi:hypothetical protein